MPKHLLGQELPTVGMFYEHVAEQSYNSFICKVIKVLLVASNLQFSYAYHERAKELDLHTF